MKIERGWNKPQPEQKPAEPTVWDQLADIINNPGNWTPAGEHSHDVQDPGHSHGISPLSDKSITDLIELASQGYGFIKVVYTSPIKRDSLRRLEWALTKDNLKSNPDWSFIDSIMMLTHKNGSTIWFA